MFAQKSSCRPLSFLLSAILLLSLFISTSPANASNNIVIVLDGTRVQTDVAPYIDSNNRTMVPIRFISEALDADVQWDGENSTISIIKEGTYIMLRVGGKDLIVNGEAIIMDTEVVIVEGRTFVPVRFIAEALDLIVTWNPEINVIQLSSLKVETLSSLEIAEHCTPAVFKITMFGLNGAEIGSGSGFFISNDGYALTNYHVVKNFPVMTATTWDGGIYEINTICDIDKELDIALIKVDGSNFKALTLGNSDKVKQGQDIFTIGSPRGYDNTISEGIVSSVNRDIEGVPYIQISAPISPGNSGGPLVNVQGEVVGINTLSVTHAQNVNFSLPINFAKSLEVFSGLSFEDLLEYIYYPSYNQIIDFGEFSNVRLLDWTKGEAGSLTLKYDAFDFYANGENDASDNFAYTLYYYTTALKDNGMSYRGDSFEGVYESATEQLTLEIDLNIKRIITITVIRKEQYYREFPYLVDFGWYSMLPQDEDVTKFENGSLMYVYKFSDAYQVQEFIEQILFPYMHRIDRLGITYRGGDTASYLLEGKGVSLVILIDYTRGYIYLDMKRL